MGKLPIGPYELMLPGGSSEVFPTLPDVLAWMNNRSNHPTMSGNTDSMEVWTPTGRSYSVEQRNYNFGVVFTDDDGTAPELICALLEQVKHYATNADGTIKKPWQMLSKHWSAITLIGSLTYGVVPGLTKNHKAWRGKPTFAPMGQLTIPLSTDISSFTETEFVTRFGYGHNGPSYHKGQVNGRHEVQVAYALARGDSVPAEVLKEYRDDPKRLPRFKELLDKPYLVGRLDPDRLDILLSLLSSNTPKVEITEENAGHLISLMMSHVPGKNPWREFDNLLFTAGVLKVRERKFETKLPDPGIPFNGFAEQLRQNIIAELARQRRATTADRLQKGEITLREAQEQENSVAEIPEYSSYSWPNKVAIAIHNKDLAFLERNLDGAGNDTTKKLIEAHFPVKLRNVSAAERRKAVFVLAGFSTPAEYAAADASLREAQAKAQTARQEESARSIAARTLYVFCGQRMSGADFVDKLIADGFTKLDTRKRGAIIKTVLLNPNNGQYFELRRKDGVADYAEAVLAKELALA